MKRLYLLGFPIAHSLSPALQNAALGALGLDIRYELRETNADGLASAAADLRADDCAGCNVTIPHKETIIPFLDQLGESAREIGAVNTVVKQDGKLVGENTDAVGFSRSLAEGGCDPRGARVALLGAGGAARAAAFALAKAGAASVVVVNRTPARAEALVADLAARLPATTFVVSSLFPRGEGGRGDGPSYDLVVNALPPTAQIDYGALRLAPGAFAYDLAYRPAETAFMREMAALGARPLGGLGMLVHQAAAALELWTGQAPPVDVMFEAACEALERSERC